MKKIIPLIIIILLAVCLSFSYSQGVWTQKTDFGGGNRFGAIGFSIGLKEYIGTGWDDNGFKKDLWEYDPANDSWTQKADFVVE